MMIPVLIAVLAAQAAAPRSQVSVQGLPARLAHDARRLFTTPTPALVIAAGGLAAAAAHPADHSAVDRLSRSAGLEAFLDGGANAGDGTVLGLSALTVYGIGLAAHNERTARQRPDGGRYSFPSGHASATFVAADVVMQEFGWKAGVPAYAGAAYVAVSRLTERQHFLSDVVFGAAAGIASARTLTIQRPAHTVTFVPVPLHGGAAIMVHAIHR